MRKPGVTAMTAAVQQFLRFFDALSDAEKQEAKATWQKVLENPILWNIIGGFARSGLG